MSSFWAVGALLLLSLLSSVCICATAELVAPVSNFRISVETNWKADEWLQLVELVLMHNVSAAQQILPSLHTFSEPQQVLDNTELSPPIKSLVRVGLDMQEPAPRIQAVFNVVDIDAKCSLLMEISTFDNQTEHTCSVEELGDWIKAHRAIGALPLTKLDKYKLGPSSDQSVILYGHPRMPQFASVWGELLKLPVTIHLRYRPLESLPNNKVKGYFAHLNIRDTEYKVTDDRFDNSTSIESIPLLKPEEMVNLGAKAALAFTSLDRLVNDSSNFPVTLPKLADTSITDAQIERFNEARMSIMSTVGPVDALISINGVLMRADSLNTFSVLSLLHDELKLHDTAQQLGIPWKTVLSLLSQRAFRESDVRFNLCGLNTFWMNDLENDDMYTQWGSNIQMLLRPSYGLRRIARNLFNLHFWMDLSDTQHLAAATQFSQLIAAGLPVRFGLVPLVDERADSRMSKLATTFVRMLQRGEKVKLLRWMHNPTTTEAGDPEIHKTLLQAQKQFDISNGEMFVNGVPLRFTKELDGEALLQIIQKETEMLTRKLVKFEISNDADLNTYFCNLPGAWKHRNPFAFAQRKNAVKLPTSWADSVEESKFSRVHVVAEAVSDELFKTMQVAQAELRFALVRVPGTHPCITINGRLIPLNNENFTSTDFEELIKVQFVEWIQPLSQIMDDMSPEEFWKASSLWWMDHIQLRSAHTNRKRNNVLESLPCDEYTCQKFDSNDPIVRLVAVVNPVSEDVQRLAPLLKLVHDMGFVSVHILWYAEPIERAPQRFTQFAGVEPVSFQGIPPVLFSLAVETPHPWMAMAIESPLDLENLIFSNDPQKNFARFQLNTLLVEGHASEMPSEQAPRGTQLVLEHANGRRLDSTIIMANLGYFQLKGQPGIMQLRLREGRSREIYEDIDEQVVIDSWLGSTIYLKLHKRPGKEEASVLDSADKSWWDRFKSTFKSNGDETINIFSVASGHLYERFLGIMFQSVLAHTKHPVKFWLIEDFLSPSFKKFMPVLASKFNFQYQLISYKWPNWLNKQTVKQRIIWGYKILFLDVLFPLNMKKVIFVDADQVVRADMQELLDVNLKGAVYGYTPFCESRKEIEGFRFWKQGYWKNHLQGKPYHISALYVVDLERFRQTAAGDIMRQQYQALSQDTSSLSNLDQDLPNNMQDLLRIHSLPQEWLWCETWCDDESLKTAKTIDLCNNPMTKEPKLDRARRLLPEWEVYDQRVEELRVFFETNTTSTPEFSHEDL